MDIFNYIWHFLTPYLRTYVSIGLTTEPKNLKYSTKSNYSTACNNFDMVSTVDSHNSNSKGLTETLRDIHTSTYQIWESEENNKLNSHI